MISLLLSRIWTSNSASFNSLVTAWTLYSFGGIYGRLQFPISYRFRTLCCFLVNVRFCAYGDGEISYISCEIHTHRCLLASVNFRPCDASNFVPRAFWGWWNFVLAVLVMYPRFLVIYPRTLWTSCMVTVDLWVVHLACNDIDTSCRTDSVCGFSCISLDRLISAVVVMTNVKVRCWIYQI